MKKTNNHAKPTKVERSKNKKQKQKTNDRLAHDNYLIEVWFPAYSRHISQNIV